MGLLPLEFTECLQDSPYFRDSLHSHEKELERTSNNIKDLIKEVKCVLSAARSESLVPMFMSDTPFSLVPRFTHEKNRNDVFFDTNYV